MQQKISQIFNLCDTCQMLKCDAKKPTKKTDLNSEQSLSIKKYKIYISIQVLCFT